MRQTGVVAGGVEHRLERLLHRPRGLVDIRAVDTQDRRPVEAGLLHEEFQKGRRQRLLVRRIDIEGPGPDRDVFRIGSLEDEKPSVPEDAVTLVEEVQQRFDGQMLGKVEGRDDGRAGRFLPPHERDGVVDLDGEAPVERGLRHAGIEIDADRLEPRLRDDLEPLAAAAAEIDGATPPSDIGRQLLQQRQIDAQPFLDEVRGSAELVFERTVQCIERLRHSRIPKLRSSRLVPTNRGYDVFTTSKTARLSIQSILLSRWTAWE
ncbi:hypothetical protein L610_003900000160 [Aminobacter sp. J44]|nr:hypothetical protein L610_003900000160 [Aminobacter sp. J44]